MDILNCFTLQLYNSIIIIIKRIICKNKVSLQLSIYDLRFIFNRTRWKLENNLTAVNMDNIVHISVVIINHINDLIVL